MKPRHVFVALLSWWIVMTGCPAVANGAVTELNATTASGGGVGETDMPQSISLSVRESTDGRRSKVTVYYFHRKVRCDDCLAVESLSKRAVAKELRGLVAIGRLEFRSILLDDKDNWHHVDEFLLTAPSLVIAESGNGQAVRWRNMDKVWDLLDSDSDYSAYVGGAVEEFLE